MKNQPIVIHCPAVFDIKTVAGHKEIFSQALLAQKDIIINAQKLRQVDTAGLQLLLNFVLTITKQNLSWAWAYPSPELLNLAELLGMAELLKLPKMDKVA